MNRTTARNVGLIAAATAVLVGLTGCTPPLNEDSDEYGIPVPGGFVDEYFESVPASASIYRDIETGKVTMLVDEGGNVVFSQDHDSSDMKFMLDDHSDASYSLDTTLSIDGVDQPVKMHYILRSESDAKELIDVYNAKIAQPVVLSTDKAPGEPPYMSLVTKVGDYITSQYREGMANGAYPTPQFAVEGEVVIKQDTVVADAYRSGDLSALMPSQSDDSTIAPPMSPPDRWESESQENSRDEPTEPSFIFDCATYDVKLQNGADVTNAISTIDGARLFSVMSSAKTISLVVKTPEPCGVKLPRNNTGETSQ